MAKMEYDEGQCELIIVAMKSYIETLQNTAETITKICNDMLESGSLAGNQGEGFRDAYKEISKGINNLRDSMKAQVDQFDAQLSGIVAIARGGTAQDAQEAMKKAAQGQGLFAPDKK